jgi:hypothetical protein
MMMILVRIARYKKQLMLNENSWLTSDVMATVGKTSRRTAQRDLEKISKLDDIGFEVNLKSPPFGLRLTRSTSNA